MGDIFSQATDVASKEGAKMELWAAGTENPMQFEKDGKLQSAYIILKGPDSKDTKREIDNVKNRMANKKKGITKSDEEYETDRENDAKLLSRLTVGGEVYIERKAEGDEKPKGEWVEVDQDLAYKIFFSVEAYRIQGSNFVVNHKNFTKG